MTTPTGTIRFSDITAEFGTPPGKNIGSYRFIQFIAGRNWTLDDGVPGSGSISFSQLRGKTLNVVVDYSGSTQLNVNSETRYNSSGVVVGGFRSRPASNSSTTKKVHHIIRTKIGGTTTIDTLTPFAPNSVSSSGYFILNAGSPNTLGTFVSVRFIPQSEWPESCFGSGWRRVCYKTPPASSDTTVSTFSDNRSLSGGSGSGGVLSFRKDTRRIIRSGWTGRTQTATETILIDYNPTLVSRGAGYNLNDVVTTTWDGRTFTFTVNRVISDGPSFRTGSGWSGIVQLNYTINSGAVIGGRGGNGGNGGANGIPAQNGGSGGDAFGISTPCTIYLSGAIRQGAGGGGGGSFQYQDIGRGCGQRYNGDGGGGGAGIPGGKGGKQQNFAPGAYDPRCSGEYRFAYDGGDGTELTGGLANTSNMLRAVNRAGNGGSLSPYSPTGKGGAGGTSGGSPGAAFVVASGGSYTLINQGGSVLGGTAFRSF